MYNYISKCVISVTSINEGQSPLTLLNARLKTEWTWSVVITLDMIKCCLGTNGLSVFTGWLNIQWSDWHWWAGKDGWLIMYMYIYQICKRRLSSLRQFKAVNQMKRRNRTIFEPSDFWCDKIEGEDQPMKNLKSLLSSLSFDEDSDLIVSEHFRVFCWFYSLLRFAITLWEIILVV